MTVLEFLLFGFGEDDVWQAQQRTEQPDRQRDVDGAHLADPLLQRVNDGQVPVCGSRKSEKERERARKSFRLEFNRKVQYKRL